MKLNLDQVFEDLQRDLELPDTPYQARHLWYLRFHRERYCSDIRYIEKYYRSGRILEIGSHPYHLTYALKRLGYNVVGLDIDPSRYSHFIKKHNLDIVPCNIETKPLPFNANTFQLIVFNEVFEHLRIDPIKTLIEINRVLSPGGIMMLSTPNLYALHRILLFLIGRGIKDPYGAFKQMHDIGHMGHLREYSVKEVKRFLVNTGYECVAVEYETYKFVIKGNWGKLANIVYMFTPKVFSPHFIVFSRKPDKKVNS
jgi:SAM-dependent methyltransferase